MREYVLMTDSCCDLPDQMAKDLQLEVQSIATIKPLYASKLACAWQMWQ